MSKVLAAMSGGVDSSVCAVLLQRMGYEVIGVTMMLSGETEVSSAESTCKSLGIEFHAVDMRDSFDKNVIAPFVSSYLSGETPNPCISCNRALKFGALFDLADSLGCRYLATGHYVKKTGSPGNWSISIADDITKDQSYVLYNLTQNQLDRLLFPLGELTKAEVREIAESLGLEAAHKSESQDICFIPDGDYAAFLEKTMGVPREAGDFVDMNGQVVGRHTGMIGYTIGQRKGLGVAFGEPRFVVRKDAALNTVTLGKSEDLFTNMLIADRLNWISIPTLTEPMTVTAKTRYSQKEAAAVIEPCGDSRVKVTFSEPQRAITVGQAVVFYDGELVVGGGTITQA